MYISSALHVYVQHAAYIYPTNRICKLTHNHPNGQERMSLSEEEEVYHLMKMSIHFVSYFFYGRAMKQNRAGKDYFLIPVSER